MKGSTDHKVGMVLLLLTVLAVPCLSQSAGIPQLRKQGAATQLIVNGKPFLIRGGELGNSSAVEPRIYEAGLGKARQAEHEHGPHSGILGTNRADGREI